MHKDRQVFALDWGKVSNLEMIDIPRIWNQAKPRDRVSDNLVYHDLDKLCPQAHWGAQQGISNGSGRQEYLQSQLCTRPRPENSLDYRAGPRKDSQQFRLHCGKKVGSSELI